jgi:hypothetical protein
MDTKDKDYSKANRPFNFDHRVKNVELPPSTEPDFSAIRAIEEAAWEKYAVFFVKSAIAN